jgi:hypothetical protein
MEKLKVDQNGTFTYFDCASTECPFVHECAQHETAGDFRSESGFSPKIKEVEGEWMCETRDTEVDKEHDAVEYHTLPIGTYNEGYVYLTDGVLKSYDGPFGDNNRDDEDGE